MEQIVVFICLPQTNTQRAEWITQSWLANHQITFQNNRCSRKETHHTKYSFSSRHHLLWKKKRRHLLGSDVVSWRRYFRKPLVGILYTRNTRRIHTRESGTGVLGIQDTLRHRRRIPWLSRYLQGNTLSNLSISCEAAMWTTFNSEPTNRTRTSVTNFGESNICFWFAYV